MAKDMTDSPEVASLKAEVSRLAAENALLRSQPKGPAVNVRLRQRFSVFSRGAVIGEFKPTVEGLTPHDIETLIRKHQTEFA